MSSPVARRRTPAEEHEDVHDQSLVGSPSSEEHESLLGHDRRPTSSSSSGPSDRYHAVYLVFYLLGMATLLPWNFFISVSSFWDYKFRDVNSTGSGNVTEFTQAVAVVEAHENQSKVS